MNLGFLLLSGYLLANGASSIVLYDYVTDKFLYVLLALFAFLPAAQEIATDPRGFLPV